MKPTADTSAAETRALVARTRQTQTAEAIYEAEVAHPARQKGLHPATFAHLSPQQHNDYYERARGFIRAGFVISKAAPAAIPVEDLP